MIEYTQSYNNWKIKIFYDVTCDNTDTLIEALMEIKCPKQHIKEALNNLNTCNLNIGLTYSNIKLKSSIMVISKASTSGQLINTIVHEYYHLIQHISKGLRIEDEEKLATLIGDLTMDFYKRVDYLLE